MEPLVSIVDYVYGWLFPGDTSSKGSKSPPPTYMNPQAYLFRRGFAYLRIASVSGAVAIGMGAYGAHVLGENSAVSADIKRIYETGNRYHLLHSVALLAVPMFRRPHVTGILFSLGILLFSGSCYTFALSHGKWAIARKFTPFGGLLLMAAWLSIIL